MEPMYQSWIDQEDARMVDAIRTRGWFIQYVGGTCAAPGCDCSDSDGPEFAYTIGLYGMGPELCIRRIKPDATLDEAWNPDLTAWTEGRPVKTFRYLGGGKAVIVGDPRRLRRRGRGDQ